MIRQRAPMKRTAFKRKPPVRVVLPVDDDTMAVLERVAPRLYRVPAPSAPRELVATPKREYVRSQKLIEAYRLIPCAFCGYWEEGAIVGAHANWGAQGKGGHIKADDSRAASACLPCHRELDQGKAWTKEERRRRWWGAHVRTVSALVALGHWPADVLVPDTTMFPEEWMP